MLLIWLSILKIMSLMGLKAMVFGKVVDGKMQVGTTTWEKDFLSVSPTSEKCT